MLNDSKPGGNVMGKVSKKKVKKENLLTLGVQCNKELNYLVYLYYLENPQNLKFTL